MTQVETHPLGPGEVELRLEDGYLRVTERGDPETVAAMEAYGALIERARARAGVTGILIIAQPVAGTTAVTDWQGIREARWRALGSSGADRIAVIVDEELSVARVRMAAIASKAKVRGFLDEADALAWLSPSSGQRRPDVDDGCRGLKGLRVGRSGEASSHERTKVGQRPRPGVADHPHHGSP